MVNYDSLLMGGKMAKRGKKCMPEPESESEDVMGRGHKKGVKKGGMTYEQRCANLAKARAAKAGKKTGGGNYTQDYVPQSQLNYAGSPLDMYFDIPEADIAQVKGDRGENVGEGMRIRRTKGGRMTSEKLVSMGRKEGGSHNGAHTGMDVPTKKQFMRGGDMEGEYPTDLSGAIKRLADLASCFKLKLVKQ
jgi:hypothetical protein